VAAFEYTCALTRNRLTTITGASIVGAAHIHQFVVAVGHFAEDGSHHKGSTEYHGRTIQLPDDRALWPNRVHLARHRKNRFQGGVKE
jgi:hypothetical protein